MVKRILTLFVFLIIAQLAGVIGSFFTFSNIESWYVFLEKPFFAPPNWVFAPAWITLYTLMGIASFLVWSSYAKTTEGQAKRRIKIALGIYAGQLLFNTLWSLVFFELQSIFWGFWVIIILWLLILVTLAKFWRVSRAAGILFIPYLLWVIFAAALNFSIWQLNP